jgi:chromosome partitioning protein
MDELQDFAGQYGLVVVDTGAEDSPQLRGAAAVADTVVVPVQPDELDLWTLPTMEVVFKGAQRHNEGLRSLIVLNRVPYQMADRLPGEVQAWIGENVRGFQDTPLVALIGRAAYGRATGEGLGVGEPQQPDIKAAAEMERLFKEVIKNERNRTIQVRRAGGKAARRK